MKTQSAQSNRDRAIHFLPASLLMCLTLACSCALNTLGAPTAWAYPSSRHGSQIDNYQGHQVADPFRWLEDDNSAETKAWVEAQNKVTFAYLEQIPQRQTIRDNLKRLWNYERYSVPFKEGHRSIERRSR